MRLPPASVQLFYDFLDFIGWGSSAHGVAFKLKAVSTLQQAIQNRVSDRRLTDIVVPVLNGQLTGNERRAASMSILDQLHQVVSL